MEFTFICRDNTGTDPEAWRGTVCPLFPFDCTEYEVCYRSSCIHLVLGEHSQGRYIYIPTLNVAMDISYLNDRFWNREQLSRKYPELSPADVISIAEALAAIHEHKC